MIYRILLKETIFALWEGQEEKRDRKRQKAYLKK